MVQGQPGEKSSRDFISINGWMQWYIPSSPTTLENTNKGIMVQKTWT
jgi:hypothetical protein